jgi:hypothetical protein
MAYVDATYITNGYVYDYVTVVLATLVCLVQDINLIF